MAVKKYIKDPEAVLDYSIRWGAPSWAATTAYNRYDWIWNPEDGRWYMCNDPHNSQAALADDVAKWDLQEDLWLSAVSVEQIDSAVWTVSGTGLVIDTSSTDGYTATVWLSGGTVSTTYTVECKITSNYGTPRTDERQFRVQIKER